MGRRLTWLTIYAVAMAYVESAVVVYLRAIYYPHGFDFPLALMPTGMVAIETGREAATLLMLLGVAALACADRWKWFLAFCLSFGIWDIFCYVWLWIFVRWPPPQRQQQRPSRAAARVSVEGSPRRVRFPFGPEWRHGGCAG